MIIRFCRYLQKQ